MTTASDDAGTTDPRDWLADAKTLRATTRRARHAYWFPLVLFGAIILASTPLYVPTLMPDGVSTYTTPDFFLGGLDPNASAITLYWLIAGPLGYLATAAFYWWRARRSGVATSVKAYVLTGIGLFGVIVLVALVNLPIGNLAIRGLTPLFAVALGLFVLARVERSPGLAVFATGYLALALVANLYNMENVVWRLGLGDVGGEVNVVVAGAVLLIAGIVAQIRTAVAGRRS